MRKSVEDVVNSIVCGDALATMRELPSESVHLIVTSPPYWNSADYEVEGQLGQSTYERYIDDLLDVWVEAERLLIPNGKLCINTPIMPVPKRTDNSTHTRKIKNISNDIEFSILCRGPTSFERYSLYIWQKQTTVKMFGSYPYPPNIYEDNTIEFINVFVKPGKPRKLPKEVKEASKLSQSLWLNLTMQVWPMYPEDVARRGGHPAPFPVVLPERLILMYTFRAAPGLGFEGDVVLDIFNGTGATCVAAQQTGRRFVGIDLNPRYCATARRRLRGEALDEPSPRLPRVRMRDVGKMMREPELPFSEKKA